MDPRQREFNAQSTDNADDEGKKALMIQSTTRLTQAADRVLLMDEDGHHASSVANEKERGNDDGRTTRRVFFGATLIAAGTTLGGETSLDVAHAASVRENSYVSLGDRETRLQWQVTPVNKRTGKTVFDAEQVGYNVQFVTYLTRFLLTFDSDCQKWWYNRGLDIPSTADGAEVAQFRSRQFAAFSASVEVGLQTYEGPDGPKKLMGSLLMRYCPDPDTLRSRSGLPPLGQDSNARAKQERECKEARRQICLLFALMEKNQPVDFLTQQLAVLDNGSIAKVQIEDRGSGYAPGYGPPQVRFPPPEAGPGYETATGRAVLAPNGKLLRVDVVNRGFGYAKPPIVTVAPPAAVRFGDASSDFAEAAEAKAIIYRTGPNKGRIERIQLTTTGAGYSPREIIRIRVSPPELPVQEGGVTATATAILEYEVSEIQIVNNGTGYAVEKPIKVFVEPPPLTARVNMNDPVLARVVSPDELLPATSIPSDDMKKKMPDFSDPQSVYSQAKFEAGKVKYGGCVGRGCYDSPVLAVAYPAAAAGKKTVFNSFRKDQDAANNDEALKNLLPPERILSGTEAGDIPEPINFLSAGQSSTSSDLLALLPGGVGLEFNALENRYALAVAPSYQGNAPFLSKNPLRKIDPDFGPRGRSPIERDMQLGISSYLRFILSGAICCSGVHLVLTPLGTIIGVDALANDALVFNVACRFHQHRRDSHSCYFCRCCEDKSAVRSCEIPRHDQNLREGLQGRWRRWFYSRLGPNLPWFLYLGWRLVRIDGVHSTHPRRRFERDRSGKFGGAHHSLCSSNRSLYRVVHSLSV